MGIYDLIIFANAEFLLRAYPEFQIAYLGEESRKDGSEPRLYSVLIDGHSEFNAQTGQCKPKFRVELPGNPILGDGKSDNQNHAIIFYHGKYLQLINANQDVSVRTKCCLLPEACVLILIIPT